MNIYCVKSTVPGFMLRNHEIYNKVMCTPRLFSTKELAIVEARRECQQRLELLLLAMIAEAALDEDVKSGDFDSAEMEIVQDVDSNDNTTVSLIDRGENSDPYLIVTIKCVELDAKPAVTP